MDSAILFIHFRAMPGIFPRIPAHQTDFGAARAVAWLDMLSDRCLSSYLFFPPVLVTSKPRAGSTAQGKLMRRSHSLH